MGMRAGSWKLKVENLQLGMKNTALDLWLVESADEKLMRSTTVLKKICP